ncbi:MAG: hypothetical protein Q9173_000091 [Seirophora scorigena]
MSETPPASPNNGRSNQPAKSEKEQITFRFCRECSNMLYPKEDRINSKLMFACRTCQYSEDAASACVFRNSIYNIIGETAGVTQDVGSDPTVGLPDLCCTLCGQAMTCDFCGRVDGEGVEDEEGDDGEEEAADDYQDGEQSSRTSVGDAPGDQKSQDTAQGGRGKSS